MPFNTKNHEYDPFVGSNVLQVYYFFFHKFNKLKALNDHNLNKKFARNFRNVYKIFH